MFGLSSRISLAVSLIFAFISVFVLCEYVIYYAVILRCAWPHIEHSHTPLRALFLSDTHLLGAIRGHWLDKLRREWQMERAFQTSLWLLNPEVVFILGDIFDEGKWSSNQNATSADQSSIQCSGWDCCSLKHGCSQDSSNTEDWDDDVRRFKWIFRHPSDTKLVVLIGNHDIGFHNEMTKRKLERFEEVFNVTSARILTIHGINFLLVNSVALHGDRCPICQHVEEELHKLSYALNCSIQGTQHGGQCKNTESLPPTAPVLLQHYPLYRVSDAMCTGVDAAPKDERYQLFQERYDVLSKNASQKLLWWFKPRLILSGHTHNGCEVLHENIYPEISVPSFSWRNRNNPSFILGIFSSSDFQLSKCFLPEERSVLALYCSSCLIIGVMTLIHLKIFRQSLHLPNVVLGKYKLL